MQPAIASAYDCCQAGLPEYKMNDRITIFAIAACKKMRQWQSGRIPSLLAAISKVTVSGRILTISLTHLQGEAINRHQASVTMKKCQFDMRTMAKIAHKHRGQFGFLTAEDVLHNTSTNHNITTPSPMKFQLKSLSMRREHSQILSAGPLLLCQ